MIEEQKELSDVKCQSTSQKTLNLTSANDMS